MRKIMLHAAMRLMQDGLVPSITDVAEEAQVSRATAYRYFPTQSALIQAAVDEALGPILEWKSTSDDAEQRVSELVRFSYPRMHEYEVPLRAALRLALDQWALVRAGKLHRDEAMVRGHRIELLTSAVAPLRRQLGKVRAERLTQALSLVFGTEALVVLKDIWGLDGDVAEEVALWTCHALIRCAAEDRAPPIRRRKLNGGAAARDEPPAGVAKRGQPKQSAHPLVTKRAVRAKGGPDTTRAQTPARKKNSIEDALAERARRKRRT